MIEEVRETSIGIPIAERRPINKSNHVVLARNTPKSTPNRMKLIIKMIRDGEMTRSMLVTNEEGNTPSQAGSTIFPEEKETFWDDKVINQSSPQVSVMAMTSGLL